VEPAQDVELSEQARLVVGKLAVERRVVEFRRVRRNRVDVRPQRSRRIRLTTSTTAILSLMNRAFHAGVQTSQSTFQLNSAAPRPV
jgi:hypothetical protein